MHVCLKMFGFFFPLKIIEIWITSVNNSKHLNLTYSPCLVVPGLSTTQKVTYLTFSFLDTAVLIDVKVTGMSQVTTHM